MLADYRIPMEDAEVDIDFSAKSAVAIFPDGSTKKVRIKKGKLTLPKEKICIIFID